MLTPGIMVLAAGSFNHHSQVHMRRTIQIESNINSFELVPPEALNVDRN